MRLLSSAFAWTVALLAALPAAAQTAPPRPAASGVGGQAAAAIDAVLPQVSSARVPEDFRPYVADGKLQLSLEDAIRLALARNTDVQLDRTQIATAKDALARAQAPFDPSLVSSFGATRAASPTFTQLSGAPTLSTLTQNAQVGYSQTLPTGAGVQLSLGASKLSSNSSFNFFNPAVSSAFTFQFSQPLLRGRGVAVNRAPILIARRSLTQARDGFEAEVNDVIQSVVGQYWNVVQARENLAVQQKSQSQAQESYNRDKRSLELGALPPLDIYRSESQVASRRVAVIQAEYALKQAEDAFRRVVGADLDPYVRALDVVLMEQPRPAGALFSIDIATALQKALGNRPEVESMRQQLASDATTIRVARNALEPSVSLTGTYQSNGLGGDQVNGSVTPPQIVARGGFGDALDQVFHFGFPVYGFGVSLALPLRNRAARAGLGDAIAAERRDEYAERQLREAITLQVSNAVHQLEQSKLSMEAAKLSFDLAQKNLDAEQRKYELGAEQIFFVLEAQTELAQAEQTLVQSEIGYRLAATAVEHETGGLLARYQVQIESLAR